MEICLIKSNGQSEARKPPSLFSMQKRKNLLEPSTPSLEFLPRFAAAEKASDESSRREDGGGLDVRGGPGRRHHQALLHLLPPPSPHPGPNPVSAPTLLST
jgi:hypothetical protein